MNFNLQDYSKIPCCGHQDDVDAEHLRYQLADTTLVALLTAFTAMALLQN